MWWNYVLDFFFSVYGFIYISTGFVLYAIAIHHTSMIIPESTRMYFVDAVKNDFCIKVFFGIVAVALFCCIAALLVIWPIPFILAVCSSKSKYTRMLNAKRNIIPEIKQVA